MGENPHFTNIRHWYDFQFDFFVEDHFHHCIPNRFDRLFILSMTASSLCSKIRLMRSLVTSIFLYACESRALIADLQRRIETMETKCTGKILRSLYKDQVTDEEVHAKIQREGNYTMQRSPDDRKRHKWQWYGQIWRPSGLAKLVLQGTVKPGRRQGGQRSTWEDNIGEWTDPKFGKNQENCRKLIVKGNCGACPKVWN